MGERMVKIETEVKLSNIQNTNDHKEIKEMLEKFIESAPAMFASKWIERVVYFILTCIVGGFIAGLYTLL